MCVPTQVKMYICLKDAVKKLQKKVNYGMKLNEPEYIELHSNYTGALRHEKKFDFMCELKKHMDLNEGNRLETHVVELTLAEAYASPEDLNIIDTLLKTNIENLEQVSKVRAISPADSVLTIHIGTIKKHGWRSLIQNISQNQLNQVQIPEILRNQR